MLYQYSKSTACTQSPSDMDRQSPRTSSALTHLSFPKKSICKIFHSFSSCWEVSYFQHITITLATSKKSKTKKFADSVWKKILIRLHFPSFLPPAPGGGPVTLPHDTHSDTVFQQAVDTISVIQHSSAVTLLLAFVLSAGDKETHHQKKQTGVHVET